MPKQSTNDKLNELLEARIRQQLDSFHAGCDRTLPERQRRHALYGTGSGGDLPSVKRSRERGGKAAAVRGWGQRKRPDPPLSPSTSRHTEDNYEHVTFQRMAYFSSTSQDPDRVFYGAVGPRNPWYVGNQNNPDPEGHGLASTTRYGARGAQKMKLWADCRRTTSPENTVRPDTPKFLRNGGSFVDEWGPPMRADAVSVKNGVFTTPKLWPENSRHVTGFKAKRPATSSWYTHETTLTARASTRAEELQSTGKIAVSPKLAKANELESTQKERLYNQSLRPYSRTGARRPGTFEIMATSRRPRTAMDAHMLSKLDVAKTMRASLGNTFLLKHSGPELIVSTPKLPNQAVSSPDAVARRFHARRVEIIRLFDLIFSDTAAGHLEVRVKHACYELATVFRDLQGKVADPILVKRQDFMDTLVQRINNYTEAMAHRLFSAFDPYNHGKIVFAELLGMLLVFSNHEDMCYKLRLKELWAFFSEFTPNRSDLEIAETLFRSCCYSVEEEAAIAACLKREFRPSLFKYQVTHGLSSLGDGGGAIGAEAAQLRSLMSDQGGTHQPKEDRAKRLSVQNLLDVCRSCPETARTFHDCVVNSMKFLGAGDSSDSILDPGTATGSATVGGLTTTSLLGRGNDRGETTDFGGVSGISTTGSSGAGGPGGPCVLGGARRRGPKINLGFATTSP